MDLTGGKDVTERAYVEAERIVKEHKAIPVPANAISVMGNIIRSLNLN
jgi:hypothetical protein